MITRGEGQVTVRRDHPMIRTLMAGARRDAVLGRGALRRVATRAPRTSRRQIAGARAGLAPVRREMRRLGSVRTGRLA